MAQTIALSRKAVRAANLRPEDLAEVLLVGKPTCTPLVEQEVKRAFGRPMRHARPEAVACGAALYAASVHRCFVPRAASGAAVAPTAPTAERGVGSSAAALGADSTEPVSPAVPDDEPGDALLIAVRRARRTHDVEAGIAAFKDVLNQVRVEISYLYSKRASELRQEDRLKEAQATLERGLEYWPDNPQIRQRLADMRAEKAWELARRGLFPQSRQHVEESLKLDPANVRARELAQELDRILGRRSARRPGRRPGR